ncbi:diguanylate cyclase/phosphodiesterase [Salinisphaera sp. T5B8]|uniref:diguanylate cyclase n=1 Tax=unclassified Salinisphaera TaxID=2649847 RepID=UPI00333FC747
MLTRWAKRCWALGAPDSPPALRRRVMLVNQLAALGFVTTVPYQLFYGLTSLSYYAPVFASNIVIMAGYAWTLWANYCRRHDSARDFVVTVAMLHLVMVTWYVGRDLGVHLFYFTIVSILPLLFERAHTRTLAALALINVTLFWLCDRNFGFAEARLVVPDAVLTVAFGFSAVAAVALISAFMTLFRYQIRFAEKKLTDSNLELARLSATDALTQLPNRRAVDAFLASWKKKADAVVGVVLCDIDYFKLYNDHYGHLRGDEALASIGAALRSVTRRDFDLVARFGGEEFIILLPQADRAYIRDTVERLRAAVQALAIPHGYRPDGLAVVTVSIGYSQFESASNEAEPCLASPIDAADKALYRAKDEGRNTATSGFLQA